MMQFFEWNLPEGSGHWARAAESARLLADAGFTALWLPRAYRNQIDDSGGCEYDLYDLGESAPTKYGGSSAYIDAIRVLQQHGINVLADISLDEKLHDADGGDVAGWLHQWGEWYAAHTGVDGFRLDEVAPEHSDFFGIWLHNLRVKFSKEFFSVGEYWKNDVGDLVCYLDKCWNCMSLFDVPLHYNFYAASQNRPAFDLCHILDGSLVAQRAVQSVTFVDTHSTQSGQNKESWVEQWFKPFAYALILLRDTGYPCVFYGDWYGTQDGLPPVDELPMLMTARVKKAYGPQHDYFDHPKTIGWTREGDAGHPESGLAVLLNSGEEDAVKRMYVGTQHAGDRFSPLFGGDQVTIGEDGHGEFSVGSGKIQVYVVP